MRLPEIALLGPSSESSPPRDDADDSESEPDSAMNLESWTGPVAFLSFFSFLAFLSFLRFLSFFSFLRRFSRRRFSFRRDRESESDDSSDELLRSRRCVESDTRRSCHS
eukprot:TRINITY_DN1371_c1_g1_i2.p4 TRINITY_DN1371_c1_g1~~TRINITY_DN1371_c1_g1_i2.p4  ORF type:complete len:109 (-),score=20.54 TRINITY_DN1371_c1_g1_i2:448-774(-)